MIIFATTNERVFDQGRRCQSQINRVRFTFRRTLPNQVEDFDPYVSLFTRPNMQWLPRGESRIGTPSLNSRRTDSILEFQSLFDRTHLRFLVSVSVSVGVTVHDTMYHP